MKALVIDPKTSGISGDMLIASLIDLTASPEILEPLAGALQDLPNCIAFNYQVKKVRSGVFSAQRLHIELQEKKLHSIDELDTIAGNLAEELNLSKKAMSLVKSVLQDLTAAEARVHCSGLHSHEIASLGTLFDVIGSILIMDKKGFLDGTIYATPPALGSGSIRIHGMEISGPAPATLEILCRHQMAYSTQAVNQELTTPTGAALLANLTSDAVDFYPAMKPLASGYGAGTREINGRSNVLRILQGRDFSAVRESIVFLETNLDDIPGEVIGYTMQKLLKEGAVDVFVTQAIGKKNRPVSVVSVITDHNACDRLIKILMEETGTLGVRVQEVPRIVADRVKKSYNFTVQGKTFEIRVKTSSIDDTMISIKPEYEDLKKMAESLGIPLYQLAEAVKRELPMIAHLNEP